MKRFRNATLGDLSDDLSACPACHEGEPHAHRTPRRPWPDSWGTSPRSPSSGHGREESVLDALLAALVGLACVGAYSVVIFAWGG